MTEIKEDDLTNMEALLTQAVRGIHVLFEHSVIAKVVQKFPQDEDLLSVESLNQIQEMMSTLISKKSLAEKRAFLAKLDENSYELLIRSYLHIIENAVKSHYKFH